MIYSAFIPILNKKVVGTNFGAILSLIVVALSFTLLAIAKVRENSPKHIGTFALFVALSLYSTAYGISERQSWLVSLGMMIIQCMACLISLRCNEVWRACTNAVVIISVSLFILSFYIPIFENCRQDKCLIFPQVFSVSVGGNGLGMDLFPILAAVLFLSRRTLLSNVLCITSSTLLILSSSSRTGIFAYGFSIFLFAFRHIIFRYRFEHVLFYSTVAYTTYPLWGNFSEKAFTERGYLWKFARESISDAGLIGYGPSYWTRLGSSLGFPTNYGTHNMWLDVIISLGYLGLLAFLGIWLRLKKLAEGSNLILVITSLMFTGMTESTFILWKLYPNSILLILFLCAQKDISRVGRI